MDAAGPQQPPAAGDGVRLDLEPGDVEILRQVLDATLRDLRVEVVNTDNAAYKRGLRGREDRIRHLLDRVGGTLPFGH